MKKKIMIFVVFILTSILSSCGINQYRYEDHEKYVSGSDFTIGESISKIEVTWINGNVTLLQDEVDKLSVKEEDYKDHPLFYCVDGNTLKIQFVEYGTNQKEFSFLEKNLTIVLPFSQENSPSIDVDIINGNCNLLETSEYKDIDIAIVNGNVKFDGVKAKDVEIDIVNGNFNADVFLADKLSLDKVNGDSTFNPIYNATQIEINTVNGIDTVYTLENLGYKVEFDSNGYFSSEYDNQKIYGTPVIIIEYEGANGNLIIKKYK